MNPLSFANNKIIIAAISFFCWVPAISAEQSTMPQTTVVIQHIEKIAKHNQDWKNAIVTGPDAQVVLMSVNPKTNPKNEIGLETHPFDQVIFVIMGEAKAIVNQEVLMVKKGDLILIPQGTPHNFINLHQNKPFNIISVYSKTDIPANAKFKTEKDSHE